MRMSWSESERGLTPTLSSKIHLPDGTQSAAGNPAIARISHVAVGNIG